MPIVGGLIRQCILLRVGSVIHVATIKDPKVMVNDIIYDDVFPIEQSEDAFNSAYVKMLEQEEEHKA